MTEKTTEEIEFQRSKEECTFKPMVHPAPPAPKSSAVPKFMETDP